MPQRPHGEAPQLVRRQRERGQNQVNLKVKISVRFRVRPMLISGSR